MEVNQDPLQAGFGIQQVIRQVASEPVPIGQLELDLLGLGYPGLVLEQHVGNWWSRCHLSLFTVLIP